MNRNFFRQFSIRSWEVILVVLLASLFCFANPGQAATKRDSTDTRILVITSQPYATDWFNTFNNEFVEELSKVRPVAPKVSYEYIDGKIAGDPALTATVTTYLQRKYDWEKFDLIVGVMTAGSTFLLEHGNQFARGIPQLFVLPSMQQSSQIEVQSSVAIVRSTGDAISGTIKNIQTLLPKVKTLYVIAGMGGDDREYYERTKRILDAEKLFENVVFLAGYDSDELIRELSRAPKDSAVLMLSYILNRHGQPVTPLQILKTAGPQIHLPIFGFYDTVLGKGIVGGHLTSSVAYGEAAAAAANRLLAGERKFFAVTAAPRYMYDWRELKRWNIDESRLPQGSRVEFRHYSAWDLYKWYIIGALLVVGLQGFLIVMLMLNRQRLRSLEKALRESNAQLENRVNERTAELTAANEELTAMNDTLDKLNREMANANNKLKELDQMKSMFIASMSHELRTPLNSIIGFTGITLQEMSGPLNEEQKDNLSRVKRSANHLLALITDVIDISKIESGKVEKQLESFSLLGMVAEAVDTIQNQLAEKGMELEVQAAPDVTMLTDRRRLLQCLINFLSNAVKYSEQGKITVGIERNDGQVELSVTDTGIGIAAEDLQKLFEPFERVKSQLQIKAGGTGLGLYLTKKLATNILRGSVSVESVHGEGSTFRIRVPEKLL